MNREAGAVTHIYQVTILQADRVTRLDAAQRAISVPEVGAVIGMAVPQECAASLHRNLAVGA